MYSQPVFWAINRSMDATFFYDYYSEANLVWITRKGEGLLPSRVRALIDWEAVATTGG